MNLNDDEAIGLINRLLERLHQADLTNFGSHLQIVYVASGAQHVETQINMGPNSVCRLRRAACRDADKYGSLRPTGDSPQPSLCREGENHE